MNNLLSNRMVLPRPTFSSKRYHISTVSLFQKNGWTCDTFICWLFCKKIGILWWKVRLAIVHCCSVFIPMVKKLRSQLNLISEELTFCKTKKNLRIKTKRRSWFYCYRKNNTESPTKLYNRTCLFIFKSGQPL